MPQWLHELPPVHDWIPHPLVLAAIIGSGLALLWLGVAVSAARSRRFGSFAFSLVLALVFLLAGVLSGAVVLGVRGYRNLTHEEVAARIEVVPLGAQKFQAVFEFSDGRRATFTLAGDELYVDAHILKWKWLAQSFGLHTQYELDRVSGRYRELDDERNRERTVHGIAPTRRIDLFRLARSQARLSRLLDAEYGSASFVPANHAAAYELRVSTTGLLIRPSGARAQS